MDLSTIGVVVGAALMIGSPAYWIWWRIQVARHWTLVDGEVVRLVPSKSEIESDRTYSPIIRTRRPDGETVEFQSSFGVGPSPWSVGDVVTVRVRGDVVKHDSFGMAFAGYGALFAIGGFLVLKSCGA